MTFIVATNVIASRPPERRPTGTPHARANWNWVVTVPGIVTMLAIEINQKLWRIFFGTPCMTKIYGWDTSEIYLRYGWICLRYVLDVSEIWLRYVWDMAYVWLSEWQAWGFWCMHIKKLAKFWKYFFYQLNLNILLFWSLQIIHFFHYRRFCNG